MELLTEEETLERWNSVVKHRDASLYRGMFPHSNHNLGEFCHKLGELCVRLVDTLQPLEWDIIWVKNHSISSPGDKADMHLFYSLRHAFGGSGLINKRPGHLFHGFEQFEMASMLRVLLTANWDIEVFVDTGDSFVTASNDGFIYIFTSSQDDLRRFEAWEPKMLLPPT